MQIRSFKVMNFGSLQSQLLSNYMAIGAQMNVR